MTEPNDETLRDWLLGRLPRSDAEALEQRLIEEHEFGARLRDAENDLLDDLARERLAGDARARASAYFAATPNDRLRLRVARALAAARAGAHARGRSGAASAPATHRRRRRASALARIVASACAVLAVAIGVRVWIARDATTAMSEAPFAITLTGGQQRGADAIELAIPRRADRVRVQAEVDGANGATYTLSVDAGDVAVFSASHLVVKSAGPYRFVETTVPASALAPGRHHLRVVAEQGASESDWVVTTHDE